MTYKVFPTNKAAVDAVKAIADKVDKRLSISQDEKLEVVAYLLAHRHRDGIHLPGHAKLSAALLDAEIIGRARGKADFFVKPAFVDLSELTFATEEAGPFPFHPRNKSGLSFLSAAASKHLFWSEVAGLGYGAAYYIAPVDFAATVGAFTAGYTPSVNFKQCDHPEDHEGAVALSERVLEAARLSGIPLVPIAEGWVCADPQRALLHWHCETTRFFNKANLRFSFLTKDRYQRQEISWGTYGL
jgi:hypothetical protein